jgi:hypothetical protein
VIADWFCKKHVEKFISYARDKRGRRTGIMALCPICHRSRLGEVMAELRRAQEPLTSRKVRLRRRRFDGEQYYITLRIPLMNPAQENPGAGDRTGARTIYSGSSGNRAAPNHRGSKAAGSVRG